MARRTPTAAVDWSSLPEGILSSIVENCITSFTDLAAFSSVCPSWRAAALAARISPDAFSPLLLRQTNCDGLWSIHDPAAASSSPARTVPLAIPASGRIINVSRGRLIIFERGGTSHTVTVINPLSGETFRSPPLPAARYDNFAFPALLLDSSTLLVLYPKCSGSYTAVLRWHIGAEAWASEHCVPSAHRFFEVVALTDGRLIVSGSAAVFTLTLDPQPSLAELARLPCWCPDWKWCPSFEFKLYSTSSWSFLFASGDEIIYLFHKSLPSNNCMFRAFRLVESASAKLPEWVQLDSRQDSALFVILRQCIPAMACPNPERWGGRSGCIYSPKSSLTDDSSDGSNAESHVWHVVDMVERMADKDYPGCLSECSTCKTNEVPQFMVTPSSSWDHLH